MRKRSAKEPLINTIARKVGRAAGTIANVTQELAASADFSKSGKARRKPTAASTSRRKKKKTAAKSSPSRTRRRSSARSR